MTIINRNNYNKINTEITKIVNDIDPIGLIGAGAPKDEYNSEINRVITELRILNKPVGVFGIVEKVFQESFGDTDVDQLKIKIIAEKIEKLLD